ncbi:MAG TPA: hypothetical protein VF395_22440, partial [Polyangiaceae bacterium]
MNQTSTEDALSDTAREPRMRLTKKISDRSKKMVMNPTVMRWISDDRVMKAAEGVMDARTRMRAAWKVLLSGHDLPTVDLSLDDSLGESEYVRPVNGKKNGANGHGTNGHGTNGHGTNGHTNGHASNGHASNGHASNGHSDISLDGTTGRAFGHSRITGGMSRSDTATLDQALKERTSLAGIGGKDVFEKCYQFLAADNARKMGMYPFFRPLDFNDGPEAVIDGR